MAWLGRDVPTGEIAHASNNASNIELYEFHVDPAEHGMMSHCDLSDPDSSCREGKKRI
jgi:hypothetical protein